MVRARLALPCRVNPHPEHTNPLYPPFCLSVSPKSCTCLSLPPTEHIGPEWKHHCTLLATRQAWSRPPQQSISSPGCEAPPSKATPSLPPPPPQRVKVGVWGIVILPVTTSSASPTSDKSGERLLCHIQTLSYSTFKLEGLIHIGWLCARLGGGGAGGQLQAHIVQSPDSSLNSKAVLRAWVSCKVRGEPGGEARQNCHQTLHSQPPPTTNLAVHQSPAMGFQPFLPARVA